MQKGNIMPEQEKNSENEVLFHYLWQILYEPEKASLPSGELPASQQLAAGLDMLLRFVLETRCFGDDLVSGHIRDARQPSRDNVLAGPLKAVHSMLQHLIWLMDEVAGGDYEQRLMLANDLSESFNNMVEYLVELSQHDRLTGLLNTNGFDKQAQKLLKADEKVHYFILSVDINAFKNFNSIYGAEKGDELLIRVGHLLQRICRPGELCARIHADQFMCLIQSQDALEAADRFNLDKAGIRPPLASRAYLFRHGIYAVEDPEIGVRQMRAYAAFAGRSVQNDLVRNYAVFDMTMAARYAVENEMLEGFENACKNSEFELVYQPKVQAGDGRIVGCEALVRWRQGTHLVMPDTFIPLFEVNGLLMVLDFYLLEKICCWLRSSLDAGQPVVPVSVNFSRTHLMEHGFVQHLKVVLDKYHVSPEWIEIEITENAFFDDRNGMLLMAEELHQAGFRIAMDDFGTGFSSLNFLRTIPLDVMKIDKLFFSNFATDVHGRLLLEDILQIAQHLGLRTVAEGVETAEEAEFLRQKGCDLIQGFYFYRPLSADKLQEILAKQ